MEGDTDVQYVVDDMLGLEIWPASRLLCEYLVDQREMVRQCVQILELGAGLGLPSLLAAKLGAPNVLATDYEPLVLDCFRKSVAANRLETPCSSSLLNWYEEVPFPLCHQFDLVLGTDILYLTRQVMPLATTLPDVLSVDPPGVALLGHQCRKAVYFDKKRQQVVEEEEDLPLNSFKEIMAEQGFHLREVARQERTAVGSRNGGVFLVLALSRSEERLEALGVYAAP